METNYNLHLSSKWLTEKIQSLIAVLDKDAENLKKNLIRLDELRTLLIKRDERSLGNLLAAIRAETTSNGTNEAKRLKIRQELADAFKCKVEQLTLSKLENLLPVELKTEIAGRKVQLQELTARLKKEYLNTAMLLTEWSRINSALLKVIFDSDNRDSVVYKAKGTARRQNNSAFVNMQF
ncbi:MAG: hypothetical protein E4H40_03295 [Candidatus Brocadiia bacterium]|nr:MAG: hypothetical protein E4H40_03295 [Candidatus Brocadiia bacterium]